MREIGNDVLSQEILFFFKRNLICSNDFQYIINIILNIILNYIRLIYFIIVIRSNVTIINININYKY